jgi:hypothetical protein
MAHRAHGGGAKWDARPIPARSTRAKWRPRRGGGHTRALPTGGYTSDSAPRRSLDDGGDPVGIGERVSRQVACRGSCYPYPRTPPCARGCSRRQGAGVTHAHACGSSSIISRQAHQHGGYAVHLVVNDGGVLTRGRFPTDFQATGPASHPMPGGCATASGRYASVS